MFEYNARYSKISRLTLDGAGRARVALHYGPAFSTYNETSDLILRDTAVGLLLGGIKDQGQAENEVLRCRFLRCSEAGLMTGYFNCMDVWVWYCRFEDCGHALFNYAGNFHAWQNLFLRSRIADVGSKNLMVFSFVNNTSIGSRRFLDFDTGHSWGSPMTISGNRIIDPTDEFPLLLGNRGPYLVMDNTFKLPPGSTKWAAKMSLGDQTFVGNTYNTTNTAKEAGRFRRVAEKTIPSPEVDASPPVLPATPQHQDRRVIEVPAGAGAGAIQQAIERASLLRGQRPIVHLPMGIYTVSNTLVIPAESDLQLVGDSAGETGTRLNWAGPKGQVLLKLAGPTHATLRDLNFDARDSSAILVENADQPGGRIFADQLNVRGPNLKAGDRGQRAERKRQRSDSLSVSGGEGQGDLAPSAIRVNGLVQTDVLLRCLQGEGNSYTWVEVSGAVGGGAVGGRAVGSGPLVPSSNQISIFTGATSSAEGQYNVRRGGHLVVRSLYHEKSTATLRGGLYLSDSGTLAIDAARFSCATSPQSPLVTVANFRGLLTVAASQFNPVGSTNPSRFEMTGDGSAASVLALNDLFWVLEPGVTSQKVWLNHADPPAAGGLLGCNMNGDRDMLKSGFGFLENVPGTNAETHSALRTPQSALDQPSTLNSQPPVGPSTLNPQPSAIPPSSATWRPCAKPAFGCRPKAAPARPTSASTA